MVKKKKQKTHDKKLTHSFTVETQNVFLRTKTPITIYDINFFSSLSDKKEKCLDIMPFAKSFTFSQSIISTNRNYRIKNKS